MGVLLTQLLLATQLLNSSEAFISQMSAHFSPSFAEQARFEERNLAQFPYEKDLSELYGTIMVAPPKGQCLSVIKSSSSEVRICRKEPVYFHMEDLDQKGVINWRIRVNSEDQTYAVSWHTPYRMARMVDYAHPWPGESQRVIVTSCEVKKNLITGRRIYFSLHTGQHWAVSFPDEDTMLPQPKALSNLMLVSHLAKGSSAKSKKDKEGKHGGKEGASADKDVKAEKDSKDKKESEGEGEKKKKDEPAEHGSKEGEKKKSGEEAAAEEQAMQDKIYKEQVASWEVGVRNAYSMNGSHFIGDSGGPPSHSQGECRYIFDYRKTDSGILECHGVESFQWILLPLTCLDGIKE